MSIERLRRLEKATAPAFADLLLAIPQDEEEFERLRLAPRPVELLMFLIDTDVPVGTAETEAPPRDRAVGRGATERGPVPERSVRRRDERGILRQQRRDPVHAHELAAWLDSVLALYGDRILPVDLSAARRWGHLCGFLGHEGADLLIAATALEHGLTVVTRNVRHFAPTGVPVLDPSSHAAT